MSEPQLAKSFSASSLGTLSLVAILVLRHGQSWIKIMVLPTTPVSEVSQKATPVQCQLPPNAASISRITLTGEGSAIVDGYDQAIAAHSGQVSMQGEVEDGLCVRWRWGEAVLVRAQKYLARDFENFVRKSEGESESARRCVFAQHKPHPSLTTHRRRPHNTASRHPANRSYEIVMPGLVRYLVGVVSLHPFMSNFVLIDCDQYEAAMGTSHRSHPIESGHRTRTLGVDSSSRQTALDDSHKRSKSDGVRKRSATMQSAGNYEDMPLHVRETTHSTEEQENLIAAFQLTLTKRDERIAEHRAEYTKVQSKNRKLKYIIAEQITKIGEQDKTIGEQEKTIGEQSKKIEEQDKTIATKEYSLNWKTKLITRAIDEYLKPHSYAIGENIDIFSPESFCNTLASLAREAAERGPMQDQISSLQKELLGRVEKVHAASDDDFTQEFRVIASLVKTLSRTVRAVSELDVADALGTGCLQQNVSHHHWTSRARKKQFVEAWVWSILIDDIFRTPFSIFGADCEVLSTAWQNMYVTDQVNGWPNPTSLSENWRCATMESMFALVDREAITHGKMNEVPKQLEPAVIATRNKIQTTIENGLKKISSDPDVSQVGNIVNKAFALAAHMSLQKSRLQVTYPKVGDTFATESMNYIPDPDGEDIDEGVVAFTVNPGLTKWGDTHGKNLDHRYDIVASLVQLEKAKEKFMERKTEHDYVDMFRESFRVALPRFEDLEALRRDRESQR